MSTMDEEHQTENKEGNKRVTFSLSHRESSSRIC